MNEKYKEYIMQKLEERDLLELLAEECSELAQASLKLIRAAEMNDNYTPISEDEAQENLWTEAIDVMMVLSMMDDLNGLKMITEDSGKWKRWAERLGYKETVR